MLNDKTLERIFADSEMQTIPVGAQSTAVTVFGRILEQIREENPYADISALLSNAGVSKF